MTLMTNVSAFSSVLVKLNALACLAIRAVGTDLTVVPSNLMENDITGEGSKSGTSVGLWI